MNKKNLVLAVLAMFMFSALSINEANAQKKKNKKNKKIEEVVAPPPPPPAPVVFSKLDSVSYALGISIAQNISNQGLKEVNSDMFAKGLEDYMKGGDMKISMEQANKMLNDYFVAMQNEKSKESIEMGKKFLAENATKEGVVTLPSGLQYKVLKEGTGAKPTLDDQVSTHYHGTLVDGTVFDSSLQRGEPATFPISGVIKGWTEALQLMPVGSKWELYIPSDLAYGERGAGGSIGPHATLIFQVELLSIVGK
ncbi:MAG: FKBP-type peptidyl-prolyl cis-trans isomerase [Bacteroidia bacterium]|nr:FKBP-type peptidyl-prolyl cis-trans isomerase [Bacteroidia bacterium]NNC84479.1 FKBP-type peptidyl-prolyl cis-trans isomerase [Bacteroidia bacterium]NNM16258.1 FKBP-type peptidyl-prolyl cis-trans isomerase [Bacteroidia bacterium]